MKVAGLPAPATGTIGEGGPATEAALNNADDVAVAPNGDIYIADYNSARLLRIRDGILTVAYRGDFREGENDFSAVAIASDGIVYFTTGQALLSLAPDGIVTEILATDPGAQVFSPELAIGPDDTIYMAGGRIPRVDLVQTNGSTTLVAGADEPATEPGEGDGGQAVDARFGRISSLAVDATGAIFLSDTDFGDIRQIAPDGVITTIFGAGPTPAAQAVDGTRAVDIGYGSAELEVSLDASDRPFVVPRLIGRVWMVEDGVIVTVAGGGFNRGTGFPPLETLLQSPVRAAFTPDGDMLVLVEDGRYLYRVGGVRVLGLIESVPGPQDINLDPLVVAASVALTAGMLFLIPFPAEFFNSTLAEHYQEIRRWFRRRRDERTDGFWQSRWGLIVGLVLMALLYGFLDPAFGLNPGSLVIFAGVLAGLILTTLGFALPVRILRRARSGDWGRLQALPIALVVGAGCVILSRLVGFVPGYLYGIVLAMVFSHEVGEDAETSELTFASTFLLVIALSSWVGLGAVRADGGGKWSEVMESALAMSTVAAFEGLVFGLLPIHGMPGRILFQRRRWLWAVIWGLAVLAFFHVLVNPQSGYLVNNAVVPVATTFGLLAFFALLSFGLSFWFRRGA
ncbi:MAG: FGLLP motif-containing membrane protein, partial [Actinomycetota bacterium]